MKLAKYCTRKYLYMTESVVLIGYFQLCVPSNCAQNGTVRKLSTMFQVPGYCLGLKIEQR